MLTFTGDVFLKDPVSLEVPLDGTLVVNLEAPLTNHTIGYPGKINLSADPENFSLTFGSRDVVVNLANNHVIDYYEPGVNDTLATLDGLATRYFGLVRPSGAYLNPVIVDVDGIRCALLGYADKSSSPVRASDTHSGAAEPTSEQITRDLADAKAAGAQRTVICVHWGEEQVALPSPRCVELARAMIDAGADLVIGHHAHCIQAFEVYRDKHIFYGLGNFYFPAHHSPTRFTSEGLPTRYVDSRPAPRNRRSLIVSWQPAAGEIDIRPAYQRPGAVVEGAFDVQRYRLPDDSAEDYRRRYNRAYNWGKLRHSLERFRENPKMPGLRHLRGITRQLRTPPRT